MAKSFLAQLKTGNGRKGYVLTELLVGIAVGFICLAAVMVSAVCIFRIDGEVKQASSDMYAVSKIRYYMIENSETVTDGLFKAENGRVINTETGLVIAENSDITEISVFYEYPPSISADEENEENASFKRCKIVCGSCTYTFIIKAY